MARWSFGLRHLFLWTAAVALGLVALRSASATWVAAMLGLTFVALTASILLAVFRQGPQRAYWIGFAAFGWAYLLLLLVSWTLGQSTTTNDNPLRARNLVTQRLSRGAYHWLYDEAFAQYNTSAAMGPSVYSGGGSSMSSMEGGYDGGGYSGGDMSSGGVMLGGVGMMPGDPPPPPPPPPGPNVTDFVNVAHALWTLLLATLGGCLAWWLYATGPRKVSPDSVGA